MSASSFNIAVIGSGVSGLACARELFDKGFDVHVFEKENRVGGHAYTQKVGDVDVDVGFMVLNRVTYPNLLKWFYDNNVRLQPSDMSFAVSLADGWMEWGSDVCSAHQRIQLELLPYVLRYHEVQERCHDLSFRERRRIKQRVHLGRVFEGTWLFDFFLEQLFQTCVCCSMVRSH